jgi:hypothetical protein
MSKDERKYFYVKVDDPEQAEEANGRDDLVEFISAETVGEWLASDAAKDEMDDAGGDLNDPTCWPRIYLIYNTNKTYIGCFSVEMEYTPNFYVSAVLS